MLLNYVNFILQVLFRSPEYIRFLYLLLQASTAKISFMRNLVNIGDVRINS